MPVKKHPSASSIILRQDVKCQEKGALSMCQVIVGTFSSFFDVSLFVDFSDNLNPIFSVSYKVYF